MPEFEDFNELVAYCRRKDRKRLIHNASIEHAEVLFKALFDEAVQSKEDVYIVSGELKEDFYERLKESAKKVFDAGKTIELAVLNEKGKDIDLKKHAFSSFIMEKGGKVYKTSSFKFPHFIVVGSNKYRLETDHSQGRAIACFDDNSIGSLLKKSFELLKEKELQ